MNPFLGEEFTDGEEMTLHVQLTVREFIENIRKNGFSHSRHSLFQQVGSELGVISSQELSDNRIRAACAFGQGLINSNAAFDESLDNDDGIAIPIELRFYKDTWWLNDEDGFSIEEIADQLLNAWRDELDEILTFEYFDYSPYLNHDA